jgi:hypothetical protein
VARATHEDFSSIEPIADGYCEPQVWSNFEHSPIAD